MLRSRGEPAATSRKVRRTSPTAVAAILEPAADDPFERMQVELETCYDAEVAAASVEPPEELRILVGSRLDDGAVGSHELGADDVVAGEAELGRQVADASAESEPVTPVEPTMPPGVTRPNSCVARVEVEPGRAALRAAIRASDRRDAAHAGEIDHEAVVADAVSGGVVTASAHCDLELVSPREVESDCDVAGSDAARDHRRPAIDECVERSVERRRTPDPWARRPHRPTICATRRDRLRDAPRRRSARAPSTRPRRRRPRSAAVRVRSRSGRRTQERRTEDRRRRHAKIAPTRKATW